MKEKYLYYTLIKCIKLMANWLLL